MRRPLDKTGEICYQEDMKWRLSCTVFVLVALAVSCVVDSVVFSDGERIARQEFSPKHVTVAQCSAWWSPGAMSDQ